MSSSLEPGLYIGGYYKDNDSKVNIQYVAKLNEDGTAFEHDFDGLKSTDNAEIKTMTVYDDELYVGGNKLHQYVAKLNEDGKTFEDILDGLKSSGAQIKTMTVYNGELYVGGDKLHQYVAKLNEDGTTFEGNFRGLKSSSLNAEINAMTVYKNELYVGGYYHDNYQHYYQYVAKSNKLRASVKEIKGGLKASSVFTGIAEIKAMVVYNDELYVGGYYKAGNNYYQYVAKLNEDGTAFEHDFDGLEPGNYGGRTQISTMVVYNDELYIGGVYKGHPDQLYHQYIAKLNEDGKTFESVFDGLKSSRYNADINAMVVYEPVDDDDDNNLPLILILGIAIGIPVLIAITYIIYRYRIKAK